MAPYHTRIIIRIISILTLVAFVCVQAVPGYALRAQSAGENDMADSVAGALGASNSEGTTIANPISNESEANVLEDDNVLFSETIREAGKYLNEEENKTWSNTAVVVMRESGESVASYKETETGYILYVGERLANWFNVFPEALAAMFVRQMYRLKYPQMPKRKIARREKEIDRKRILPQLFSLYRPIKENKWLSRVEKIAAELSVESEKGQFLFSFCAGVVILGAILVYSIVYLIITGHPISSEMGTKMLEYGMAAGAFIMFGGPAILIMFLAKFYDIGKSIKLLFSPLFLPKLDKIEAPETPSAKRLLFGPDNDSDGEFIEKESQKKVAVQFLKKLLSSKNWETANLADKSTSGPLAFHSESIESLFYAGKAEGLNAYIRYIVRSLENERDFYYEERCFYRDTVLPLVLFLLEAGKIKDADMVARKASARISYFIFRHRSVSAKEEYQKEELHQLRMALLACTGRIRGFFKSIYPGMLPSHSYISRDEQINFLTVIYALTISGKIDPRFFIFQCIQKLKAGLSTDISELSILLYTALGLTSAEIATDRNYHDNEALLWVAKIFRGKEIARRNIDEILKREPNFYWVNPDIIEELVHLGRAEQAFSLLENEQYGFGWPPLIIGLLKEKKLHPDLLKDIISYYNEDLPNNHLVIIRYLDSEDKNRFRTELNELRKTEVPFTDQIITAFLELEDKNKFIAQLNELRKMGIPFTDQIITAFLDSEDKDKFVADLAAYCKSGLLFKEPMITEFLDSKDKAAFIKDYDEGKSAVHSGRFDINNKFHLYANYNSILGQIEFLGIRRDISWENYLNIIERVKSSQRLEDAIEGDITSEQKQEVRGFVYEAYLLREKILEIQKRAQELSRPMVVVENLSYGAVALSPITEERNNQKYITGTDILVISTKIGSSQCHNNERYIRQDLFKQAEVDFILTQKPVVVVVDASTSVADPGRTSPHIPDGHKGYINYFAMVDEALGVTIDPTNFNKNDQWLNGLRQEQASKNLIASLKELAVQSDTDQPYRFYFWYPGEKELYLRVGKRVATPAKKIEDVKDLVGPSVVFFQSAMEPEAVPENIKRDFIGGNYHPAYYDDTEHFKEFYLDYEEGYGVVLSKRFINLARRYFMEFVAQYGVEIVPSLPIPAAPPREIDIIALDLDGTIALTDLPPDQKMLSILVSLLKKGKKILIITEDIENNLNSRFIDLIPADLRQNLVIFSDGGTNGYTFTSSGEKIYFEDYNQRSGISAELRSRILTALNENFVGRYELDTRPNRVSPEYRIDLCNVKDRTNFINGVHKLFDHHNIVAKAYKVGRTSVKIVLQHKEHALRYWIDKNQAEISRILIIADSAKTDQPDRELLAQFPEAASVSVGRYANTISQTNPNIVQLVGEGIKGTHRVLSVLDNQGAIPAAILKPTNGQKMGEFHMAESNAMGYYLNLTSAILLPLA